MHRCPDPLPISLCLPSWILQYPTLTIGFALCRPLGKIYFMTPIAVIVCGSQCPIPGCHCFSDSCMRLTHAIRTDCLQRVRHSFVFLMFSAKCLQRVLSRSCRHGLQFMFPCIRATLSMHALDTELQLSFAIHCCFMQQQCSKRTV